jgi:hypothetical protein
MKLCQITYIQFAFFAEGESNIQKMTTIYRCTFMDRGYCRKEGVLPSRANQLPHGSRLCNQASTDDRELITCDSAEVVSNEIKAVDSRDGAGLS